MLNSLPSVTGPSSWQVGAFRLHIRFGRECSQPARQSGDCSSQPPEGLSSPCSLTISSDSLSNLPEAQELKIWKGSASAIQ